MSKQPANFNKKILLTILAVVVIVVIGAFTNTQVSNQKTRNRIAAQYNLIRLPTSLRLGSRQFDGRPYFDDSPSSVIEWVYTYTPVSNNLNFQTIHDSLTQSLQMAGYTINRETSLGTLTAHNQKVKVKFSIDGDQKPASKVQGVTAEAYE